MSGSSRPGSNSSTRRRQISLSKSTPNLHVPNPSPPSPEIVLDQATPVLSSPQRSPPATTELQKQSIGQRSDVRSRANAATTRFNSRSRSRSSSSTASSTDSEYDPPSPPPAVEQRPPALTRSSKSSGIHPSLAPLLSSRTGSYASLPRSLSSAHLANFAPPFYNRPSTPLPPSPSLTSLLRPSFSASPSRHTTPDDSEAEQQHNQSATTRSLTGLSTPTTTTTTLADTSSQTQLLQTARAAQPLPRASPKVPTYEYYGFVLYLTSSLFFLGYVLWSYLPSPFLHQLGIYYYPDRWWSLALPAWIVMAVGFVYVGLARYNIEILTLPLGSLGTVVDEVGVVAVVDERTGRLLTKRGSGRRGRYAENQHGNVDETGRDWRWKDCWNEGTDAVLDVPIGGVCEVLYGDT